MSNTPILNTTSDLGSVHCLDGVYTLLDKSKKRKNRANAFVIPHYAEVGGSVLSRLSIIMSYLSHLAQQRAQLL